MLAGAWAASIGRRGVAVGVARTAAEEGLGSYWLKREENLVDFGVFGCGRRSRPGEL